MASIVIKQVGVLPYLQTFLIKCEPNIKLEYVQSA